MKTIALVILFALSDAEALKKAIGLFGPWAMIASIRDARSANWFRQVGFASTNCMVPFTVLGTGFNDWDNAFADIVAKPPIIGGPYKGTITFKADLAVAATVKLYIDGQQFVSDLQSAAGTISIPVNTTALANGMHFVCASTGSDIVHGNNLLASPAYLFKTDQTIAANPLLDWWPRGLTAMATPAIKLTLP